MFNKQHYLELLKSIIEKTCCICSIFKYNYNNMNEIKFPYNCIYNDKYKELVLYQIISKSKELDIKNEVSELLSNDYCLCRICDNVECFNFYIRRVLISKVQNETRNYYCICKKIINEENLIKGFYTKHKKMFLDRKINKETQIISKLYKMLVDNIEDIQQYER